MSLTLAERRGVDTGIPGPDSGTLKFVGFRSVALLQSHQRIPPLHDYYVPDLVEL